MPRRVGRYTTHETSELIRMFEEHYSIYKICRNLNRSQKSIRNNLIRLGKIEGEITPKRYDKVVKDYELGENKYLGQLNLIIILFFLTLIMIINPHFNPIVIIIYNLVKYFG